MKQRSKPYIGQSVYIVYNNRAILSTNVVEGNHTIVTKVGRKYFYVAFKYCGQLLGFHIDTWRQKSEYTPDFHLYENKQEYLDLVKKKVLLLKIEEKLRYTSNCDDYTLEQVEKIAEILGIKLEEENKS